MVLHGTVNRDMCKGYKVGHLRMKEYAFPIYAAKNTYLFILGKILKNEAFGLFNNVWHLFR